MHDMYPSYFAVLYREVHRVFMAIARPRLPQTASAKAAPRGSGDLCQLGRGSGDPMPIGIAMYPGIAC